MAWHAVQAKDTPGPAQSTRPAPAVVASRRRFVPAASAMSDGLAKLVWLMVAIVEAILTLDFVFRLIGARDEGFVHGIFVVGSTLSSPFNGIFASVAHQLPYTLTWSDLVALVLCPVAGLLLVRLIRAARPRPRVVA